MSGQRARCGKLAPGLRSGVSGRQHRNHLARPCTDGDERVSVGHCAATQLEISRRRLWAQAHSVPLPHCTGSDEDQVAPWCGPAWEGLLLELAGIFLHATRPVLRLRMFMRMTEGREESGCDSQPPPSGTHRPHRTPELRRTVLDSRTALAWTTDQVAPWRGCCEWAKLRLAALRCSLSLAASRITCRTYMPRSQVQRRERADEGDEGVDASARARLPGWARAVRPRRGGRP